MKVFVTGATGYIGNAVAQELQKAGHKVLGLARSEKSAQKLQSQNIEIVRANLKDLEKLKSAASSVDTVIHAAVEYGPEISIIDSAAVEAILNIFKGTHKTFIYTSGTWMYGSTGDNFADDDTPLNPMQVTAWRLPIEQKVLAAGAQGIRVMIIRPAMVYGHGGGVLGGMVNDAGKDGFIRYIGNGNNRWAMVHVDDLARLYVAAMEHAPSGTALTASDGKALRVREIAELLSHQADIPNNIKEWKLEEARIKLGVLADALAIDQQIKSTNARELLAWEPQAPSLAEEVKHPLSRISN